MTELNSRRRKFSKRFEIFMCRGSYKKFPGGMASEMLQANLAVGTLKIGGLGIMNRLHKVWKGIKVRPTH